MARGALKKMEPVNVQLTIVPTELDEPDPMDALLEAPVPARTRKAPAIVAAPKAVAAPAPTPVPAPRRTGLIVASALGGGVVIGGGAVGVVGLVLAAGAALVGGGVALWLVLGSGDASVVEELPVAVEAPVADPEATPVDETPVDAPSSPKSPAGTTPSKPAGGAPVGPVVVKIITDPPAATVVVDGQEMGRSPAKLELPAGSHQLTLSSGKVTGSFPIDTSTSKLCFSVQGKKIAQVTCN